MTGSKVQLTPEESGVVQGRLSQNAARQKLEEKEGKEKEKKNEKEKEGTQWEIARFASQGGMEWNGMGTGWLTI